MTCKPSLNGHKIQNLIEAVNKLENKVCSITIILSSDDPWQYIYIFFFWFINSYIHYY